jgi:hypothetical protein
LEQNRSALERERSDCAAARRTYEEKAARQDALAYQNAAALCSRSCLGPTFSEYQIFQDLGKMRSKMSASTLHASGKFHFYRPFPFPAAFAENMVKSIKPR